MLQVDLDRDGDRPLYQQIADWIVAQIEAGEYKPRRSIHSETDLMGIFDVSRVTVRLAVAELRERGYVYTVPQRGSYVTPPEERPR